MEQQVRDFYEKYLEFDTYLEFRMFDLEKKYKGKPIMFSKYASNIDEVQKIMDEYDNKRYIVYVGCNTRPTKSRKDSSVKFRRTFFIDIESDSEKPPLNNEVYYRKLLHTALYVWNRFREIKIEPNLLLESGRGLHIGIKIMPLSSETYDARFVSWFKDLVKDFMDNRPCKDIKFDDSVFNLSRIQSCPGFSHNKYPERPRRKILKLYFNENNLLGFLNRKKVYEIKVKRSFPNYKTKYNQKTFWKSPEWLLISENRDLPEGEIHTKLLYILKMLARDSGIPKEVLQDELRKLGYNEVVDEPPEDAVYSPWVMFNWCMKHFEYCFDRNIVTTFPFKQERYMVKGETDDCPDGKLYPIREITTYRGLINYIRDFNANFMNIEGQKYIVYYDLLWSKIKRGVKNEKLLKYVEFLKLKDFISTESNYISVGDL